jgi:hypothetical protein
VQEVEREPIVALGPQLLPVDTEVEDFAVRALRVVLHQLEVAHADAPLDLVQYAAARRPEPHACAV